MTYLLDANVFMTAARLHYGFDFCPAFWDWIVKEYQAGHIFCIQRVRDELLAGSDSLAEWAQGLDDDFFLPVEGQTMPALSQVASWVNRHVTYSAAAKNTFLEQFS